VQNNNNITLPVYLYLLIFPRKVTCSKEHLLHSIGRVESNGAV